MIKFSKKKLLNFNYVNNISLLSSNSKGEQRTEKIKLKKIQDTNEMQITYYVTTKNTKSLYHDN